MEHRRHGMTLIKTLQHRYALSEKGARDLIKGCIACMLFNFILMFPVGLLYYLVGELLDTGNVNTQHRILYGIATVACLLLIVFTYYLQYNATYLTTYVESGVRRVSLAERLRRLPLSFFGKKDLSDLTSTIMADCATLETASSHWIPELIGGILSAAIVGLGLLFFDWRMALAALWVLPVSFLIILFSTKIQNLLGRKQMAAKMACADGIQECLETLRDLRACNAEQSYMKGLQEKIQKVERQAIVSEAGTAVFVGSAQLVLKFGIATVALAGSIFLINGTLSLIGFFMFLLVASRIYDPMMTALQNLTAIIMLNVQTDRMNTILEHPIQQGSDAFSHNGCDIAFNHVSFAYDTSETVLRDVSFIARQGEVTALIGPSGGGKTTVSRLAARFWDISEGIITVGGTDISTVDPETLMSLYAIVFQDVTLFNNTVMENIRIGRKDATDEEVLEAARMAHCDVFAERLPQGWNTLIGENGSELSGGERQRISIARALLKDAPIILLDEATASLDVENETMIQESLSHLIRNKTVLVIAHRMRTVAGADKIVVLKDGSVCQQGHPNDLLREDGLYRDMVNMQSKAGEWSMNTTH